MDFYISIYLFIDSFVSLHVFIYLFIYKQTLDGNLMSMNEGRSFLFSFFLPF